MLFKIDQWETKFGNYQTFYLVQLMSLFLFISCFVIWKLLKSTHWQNTQVQQTDSFRYTDVSVHVSKAWVFLFFIQIFWAYVIYGK